MFAGPRNIGGRIQRPTSRCPRDGTYTMRDDDVVVIVVDG